MMAVSWYPIVVSVLLLVLCGRTIVLALRGPRGLEKQALCGWCSYPVTHPIPEACPECGKDPLRVGVVTPRQSIRRPSVFWTLACWTILAVLIGLIAGTYGANRMRQARAIAARTAAMANRVTTQSTTLSYRLNADPASLTGRRAFSAQVEHASETNGQNVVTARNATITFGSAQGASATIEVDLLTGHMTCLHADRKTTESSTIDAEQIAATLVSLGPDITEAEAKVHAGAIKAALESAGPSGGQAGGPSNAQTARSSTMLRLEPAYSGLGLKPPICFGTGTSMNTGTRPPPAGKPPLIDPIMAVQFGTPIAMVLIGWVAIPLRMASVRRREDAAASATAVAADGEAVPR